MYEQFGKLKFVVSNRYGIDMKEIQLVIIRHNALNQYTTYNYPLLTKVTDMHLEYTLILSYICFLDV